MATHIQSVELQSIGSNQPQRLKRIMDNYVQYVMSLEPIPFFLSRGCDFYPQDEQRPVFGNWRCWQN
jgi:hypothetical protein